MIVMSLIGMFLFAYRFAGMKGHISKLVYYWQLTDPHERNLKKTAFFGDRNLGMYDGGTLAGAVGKNVLIWGRYGLNIYRTNTETEFVTFYNCTNSNTKTPGIVKKSYDGLRVWQETVVPGSQVFVVYDAEYSKFIGKSKLARRVISNLDYDVRILKFCNDPY